jgi:hypothetical protein
MTTKAEIYAALVEMINKSTYEIEVCVPSDDYYARGVEGDDWSKSTITVIRPESLIMYLEEAMVEE